MLIKKPDDVKPSEITDKKAYLSRRTFLRAGILAGSMAATGVLYKTLLAPPRKVRAGKKLALATVPSAPGAAPGEKANSYEEIASYNNFYEFSTDKYAVAEEAKGFVTRPWTISVEGFVKNPRVYDLDDLVKIAPLEERIYRLRCVEGWSMVIPWMGLPLQALIRAVEPTSQAKFVSFTTVVDRKQMPGQRGDVLEWPYVEGLRIDEAAHPLTLLAVGLYGESLPPQNGAPIRLVVPWKYGFKGAKSIVKIRFLEEQPETTWHQYAPNEYGFYSNVNPDVPHPRWSQARERRIGELGKRDTVLFNGYGAEVASLYAGMDLRRYF